MAGGRRCREHGISPETLSDLRSSLADHLSTVRESDETWDSSIFSITLGVLPISILLAVHRTETRRAFWLGFALFGSAYLRFSLVLSIESRMMTTKALDFLDSKLPRSIPAGFAYFDYDNDGSMDLYVVNNSQPNALYLNKGNGVFNDVTAVAGSNPWFSNILAGPPLTRSIGNKDDFVWIGNNTKTAVQLRPRIACAIDITTAMMTTKIKICSKLYPAIT